MFRVESLTFANNHEIVIHKIELRIHEFKSKAYHPNQYNYRIYKQSTAWQARVAAQVLAANLSCCGSRIKFKS